MEFEYSGNGEENDDAVSDGVEAAGEGNVHDLVDAFGLGFECQGPVVRGRSGVRLIDKCTKRDEIYLTYRHWKITTMMNIIPWPVIRTAAAMVALLNRFPFDRMRYMSASIEHLVNVCARQNMICVIMMNCRPDFNFE